MMSLERAALLQQKKALLQAMYEATLIDRGDEAACATVLIENERRIEKLQKIEEALLERPQGRPGEEVLTEELLSLMVSIAAHTKAMQHTVQSAREALLKSVYEIQKSTAIEKNYGKILTTSIFVDKDFS